MAEPTRGAVAAARLQAAAADLVAEARRLPADLIHWSPGDGVWSVMDNLCHVREFVPFWTGETLRMVRAPHERWGRDHHDAARLSAVADTSQLSLDGVLDDLDAAVHAAAADPERAGRGGAGDRSRKPQPALGGQAGVVRRRSAARRSRGQASRPDSPQRR